MTEWEQAVAAAARSGRGNWPGLSLHIETFVTHVRERQTTASELGRHGSDLYFACACAHGDVTALRQFEQRLIPVIKRDILRADIKGLALEDVLQGLRVFLLAGDRPRIAGYAGRASLLIWLRTVAVRWAIDHTTKRDVELLPLMPRLLDGLADQEVDPADVATRSKFQEVFQDAFDDALSSLSPQAKSVLRMHYFECLNIDDIGAAYQVHRATVARWLLSIRTAVLMKVRERLSASLRSTSSDFHALASVLGPELHISVDRLLASRVSETIGGEPR